MRIRRLPARRIVGFLPLLLAMFALALPAGAAAAGTGSITGTVTAVVGGGPLEGVVVCAYGVQAATAEVETCEVTDVAGAYEIAALPAGKYKVWFWPREMNYLSQYWEEVGEWSAATPVTVVAGGATSGIDAALARGATISGRVTAAATGLAVSGVEVCAFEASEEGGECALTNSSGLYSVVGLHADSYAVYFYPEGSGQGLIGQVFDGREFGEEPNLVTLAAEGEASGIDAALKVGGTISGTVRLAATSAPLAGVRVCITDAEFSESLGCLTTPASGGYKFTGVWKASFKVVFSAEEEEVFDPSPIVDAYPTQWWNRASSFTTATPIAVAPPAVVSGIDAFLGPPAAPPSSGSGGSTTTVTPATVKPIKAPKRLLCRRGFVKRKIHGTVKCVKRHKVHGHRHHHHAGK